jgi:hypothetical protein
MYYLTHITFQGIFIASIIAAVIIGDWWANR